MFGWAEAKSEIPGHCCAELPSLVARIGCVDRCDLMGRPPQSGGPAFRFMASEVAEMEACLFGANNTVPSREVLCSFAERFSASPERAGKIIVQPKQIWNWFQNRRYAQKAKTVKSPGKLCVSPMPRDDSLPVRSMPNPIPLPSGRSALDNNAPMEFEAKSTKDGAWYDVATFVSHKLFETGEPEVRVRFGGFEAEEEEWVNVRKHVRQRSLPCEASECVAVLPGDLILCFQEGKDQALYFDAHVLDAQRRRHDVRGCRCRFLVRYDHDQSEEIVPLRKVCRRPETDYRLQLLHSSKEQVRMEPKNTESFSLMNTSRDISCLPEKLRQECKQEGNTEVMVMSAPPSHPKESMAMETMMTEDGSSNAGAIAMGVPAGMDNGSSTSQNMEIE